MRKLTVALALGNGSRSEQWTRRLSEHGFDVRARTSLSDVEDLSRMGRLDAVVIVLATGLSDSVFARVAQWRQSHLSHAVILVVAESSETLAVAALRAGVTDYLREPVSGEDLLGSVERAIGERGGEGGDLGGQPLGGEVFERMLGDSHAMREVRTYVERVARTDSNVLITGETGVGKELVARGIHAASPRNGKSLISINCAAIPDTLLESELFGFERGAFTGADRTREGSLKAADGGTVFFDEIGDMGMAAQAKILRAIEAREIQRLGGSRSVPLDIRVIAATNQDLETLVKDGRFRKDLFYRLNVARVHLPPLRERQDDLVPLVDFYIDRFNRQFGRRLRGLTPHALDQLRHHDWPGNVRELKNLIEALFVNLGGERFDYVDLPEAFCVRLGATDVSVPERDRLLDALFATNWNKSRAAQELHWSRMTLYRKLAKYHLVRDQATHRQRS